MEDVENSAAPNEKETIKNLISQRDKLNSKQKLLEQQFVSLREITDAHEAQQMRQWEEEKQAKSKEASKLSHEKIKHKAIEGKMNTFNMLKEFIPNKTAMAEFASKAPEARWKMIKEAYEKQKIALRGDKEKFMKLNEDYRTLQTRPYQNYFGIRVTN